MKKKIYKIWGVGLVLVLAASLLFAVAPVSAGTLSWSTETIPSTTGKVLVAGSDVSDMAVSADGQTIYAVSTENTAIYKSTNGGETWSALTNPTGITSVGLVAVAPDNKDIVAVTANTTRVYVSNNGGSTWGDLSIPQQSGYTAAAALQDLTISPDDSGVHYVAVAGAEAAAGNAWYFNIGAAAPAWKEVRTKDGVANAFSSSNVTGAVAFSPNFASDKVMVAVTSYYGAGTDNVNFQIFSLSTRLWNVDAGFSGYPVTIESGTEYSALTAASISLAPDYLGADDTLRLAFVGLSIDGVTDDDGIYRLSDTSVKQLKGSTAIQSIAYNGTNLVAGASATNIVYRSADPTVTTPTVSLATSMKRPGLEGPVVVAWSGTKVVAGSSGDDSAFAVSTDNGKTFNDISLIDTTFETVGDMAVSADGGIVYLLTSDNATYAGPDLSVWRKEAAWQRVLTLNTATSTEFIVRIAPDNANSVYLARQGYPTMYHSKDGGVTKWFTRIAADIVGDIAVESADILYASKSGDDTVRKSTNSGFTWASSKDAGLVAGTIANIKSLSKDNLIVGGTSGYIAYSTDGNSTWTNTGPGQKQVNDSATAVKVTASGLATDSFIYAASQVAAKSVVRWKIGTSTSWSDIISGTIAEKVYDLGLYKGVLYALASDDTDSAVYRTLSPSTATSTSTWSTKATTAADDVVLNDTPQALTITSDYKLWALDTNNKKLYSFLDTLAAAGPTLSSPPNGEVIKVNIVSGGAFSVSTVWQRLSEATKYNVEFALDSAFNESLGPVDKVSSDAVIAYLATASTWGFNPETTYYWRIRVASDGPLYSPWSEVRAFVVQKLPEPLPPVTIPPAPTPTIILPAPVVTIPPAPPAPVPTITVAVPPAPPAPAITLPQPTVILPPAPAPVAPIPTWTLLAIILIGAVLVIALIVLIVRTRRPA